MAEDSIDKLEAAAKARAQSSFLPHVREGYIVCQCGKNYYTEAKASQCCGVDSKHLMKMRGKSMSQEPADDTVGDVFQALAEHYAELWNDLHDAGMEPSDVGMAKVAAELDEGSWAVHHDDDTGKWAAVEVDDDDEPAEGERLSYARSVSGGGKAPRVKGKSGVFTDKRGHKYKLQSGRRVPLGDKKAATAPAAKKPAGGAPKKTSPSTTTKAPATEKAAKKPAAATSYHEQVKAKASANGNSPAKGALAKAVGKAEEVTDAVAEKAEAVADFLNTPISEVPARLRDMFRKAPDDPAAVMKEAEKAKTRIEAAINAGLASPETTKKVKEIVETNQQTLMAKLGGLAAGVAARTAKVVGGLGLIGIGAGMGALGVAAAATNPIFFAIGSFDGILDESVELMAHGAGMVSGKSGDGARPKKYARDAATDADDATEPESFGETLPMSVIRKLAVDYYTGVIEDLQAEFGADVTDSKATEPTLFDDAASVES